MSSHKAIKNRARIVIDVLKSLFPVVTCSLHYSTDWELLVAVMLSAQCTDKQVNIVTRTLFKKYPAFADYLSISQCELEREIRSTGFYHQKAKNIIASAQMIHTLYADRVPGTMAKLLRLPGVARKTANVVLGELFDVAVGIAVDTHVRRLSKLYGLTKQSYPEKIEKELMVVIPKKEWREFTLRMIEYGRKYCPARKHNHELCPITIAMQK